MVAIRAVSFVVILIIMAVLANTMSMTARERTSEYATLKALGFPPWQVSGMVLGESMLLALLGGVAGILLTYPVAAIFHDATGTLFRSFFVSTQTNLLQIAAALLTGLWLRPPRWSRSIGFESSRAFGPSDPLRP